MIAADYREKKVISHLDRKILDIRPLRVADFIVSEKCAIERKTGPDLVKSIMQGRIFRQAEAMSKFERAILIIEGDGIFGIPGIHPNALMAAIASLVANYGLSVVCTEDAAETARFISAVWKKQGKGKSEIPMRSEKKPKDNGILRQFLLEGFPDIGPKTAKSILKEFGSPINFFNADRKGMGKVRGLGKKRVEGIRKVLGND